MLQKINNVNITIDVRTTLFRVINSNSKTSNTGVSALLTYTSYITPTTAKAMAALKRVSAEDQSSIQRGIHRSGIKLQLLPHRTQLLNGGKRRWMVVSGNSLCTLLAWG